MRPITAGERADAVEIHRAVVEIHGAITRLAATGRQARLEEMSSAAKLFIETTDATFEQDVIERSKEVPVVVDFWAEWCQPCRLLTPVLEKLASDFAGKFVLVKANTDQVQAVARQFRIQSIPAVYGFRDGELLDFFVGLLREHEIKSWLERLLPAEADERAAEASKIAQIDPQGAEQRFREALELDASLPKAKTGLAALLLAQGRLDECRELMEELEQRGFLEPAAERIKAALELHSKAREAGSVDECRAAVEADPDKPDLKLRLAEALAADGEYEEALEAGLELVRDHKQQFGEPARKIMVDIFQVLPNDSELTRTYRRRLAAALY
jgi:putative thioredoxin